MHSILNLQKMNKLQFCFNLLLFFNLCFTSNYGTAQNFKYGGTKTICGLGYSVPKDFKIDKDGNIYTVGIFAGEIDLDPGPDSLKFNSPSASNVFVQKLNKNGALVWGKSIGGPRNEFVSGIDIDSDGNVYVYGNFDSSINFTEPDFKGKRISSGFTDPFLLKFDSNGNYVWALVDGLPGTEYDKTLNITSENDIIITREYDPDPNIQNGRKNIDITKHTSNGSKIWRKTFDGANPFAPGDKGIESCKVSKYGSIYLYGRFFYGFDADPGPGVVNLTNFNNTGSSFLIKLNKQGEYVWSKTWISTEGCGPSSLTLDENDHLYLSGGFRGQMIVNNKTLTSNNMASDIFIEKLDSNGNFIWFKYLSSESPKNFQDIAIINKNKHLFIVGQYESKSYSKLDVNPGAAKYYLNHSGIMNIFQLLLDSSGNFVEAFSTNSFFEKGINFTQATQKNEVYSVGGFAETVDFNPDNAVTDSIKSKGSLDVYIQKLQFCFANFNYKNDTSCNPLVLKNKIVYNTGVYYDTFINQFGCDSIITYNFTLDTLNLEIRQNGDSLYSLTKNAKYQWFDCNNNIILPNDTFHFFVPKYNSKYSVIIKNIACVDTSNCITIDKVNHLNKLLNTTLKITPNPSNGAFKITGLKPKSDFYIVNAVGQKVDYIFENDILELRGIKGLFFLVFDAKAYPIVID